LEQLSEFIVINVKINAIPFSITWPCNATWYLLFKRLGF
jgi:hypothetical protein